MKSPPESPESKQLIEERTQAEIARRCVASGTLATAWFRDPERYQAHAFARSISAVCDQIAADAMAGRGTWYALEAPPRHGKSEHVGRILPARLMALMPGASVLYATSTDDRADDVSMAARAAVEKLAPAFPHLRRGITWTRTSWVTEGGGRWTGVGSGVATGGIGAKLAVLDDVTGSAERQRSAAWKRATRRWLLEDAISRLEGGPLVVMETRRGLDDISGWLESEYPGRLKRFTWRCRAEKGEQDGRKPGEYLWPEKFGAEWHASMPHLVDSSPIWSSLYQQRPTREGGTVILEEWLSHRYAMTPEMAAHGCRGIVIAVDPAAKTSQHNDPTAIVVAGLRPRGNGSDVLILHVEAKRREAPDTERRIEDLARYWNATARTSVTVLVEDTSVGQAWVPSLRRRGLTVLPVNVAGRGDKVARMHPHLGRWAAGEILLPSAAPWVAEYVGEMVSVPDSAHDDQWDATSLLLGYLSSVVGRRPAASDILRALGAQ